MYEEIKYAINSTAERGIVPENNFNKHKGFNEWSSGISSKDHPSILQVLLEKGKDTDVEGHDLPSLVYVSREKKLGYPHNFKAGALNVLVGMLYDCAVEDVLTGFSIQCRGWKSAFYTPKRDAFLGCAPVNLNEALTQHKRWATGQLEIFVSKFSPVTHGIRHTRIAECTGYSFYGLWGPSSLSIICYGVLPALCMLSGLSIFPKISDPWFLLFVFLSAWAYIYSAIEFMWVGGASLKSWWNEQRMWMFKGVSCYLFALIQVVFKLLGLSKVGFEVTSKVADGEAAKRYEAEIFEFGVASALFIPPSIIALVNLIALMGGIAGVIIKGYPALEGMFIQGILSSYPLYEGMFLRKDKGNMPTSITAISVLAAAFMCGVASTISP